MGAAPADDVIIAPTITSLTTEASGAVVVTGSHGGRYCGLLALRTGVRAIAFHDAGIGFAGAGIGALPLLDRDGIAAVAVSHHSARIGDPADMISRGFLSAVNNAARNLGLGLGDSMQQSLIGLQRASNPAASVPECSLPQEGRWLLSTDGGCRSLVLVDSASLIDRDRDAGAIVVTGSHGGLVGGNPAYAIRAECYAAVFNDAGVGMDRAGIGRLPVLDERGIAGLTVDANTARIGEAASTFGGVISHANDAALRRGALVGDVVGPLLLSWLTRV